MTRMILASIALAGTMIAAPVAAHQKGIVVDGYRVPLSPNNDSNKWWLDYRTDISEAKRELASDLRRATDEEDRRDAYEEYRQEIRDARHDYRKEMTERGYRVANFKQNNRRLARR